MSFKLSRVGGAFAALIAALVFFPSLWGLALRWDDNDNIFQNPLYRPVTGDSIGKLWSGFVFFDYHPVLSTVWAGLAAVSAGSGGTISPLLFHLFNLALHAANAALVFGILARLLKAPGEKDSAAAVTLGAFAGALFWAIHPLQVEPVSWITGGKDVFSGFFALSSLTCLIHGFELLQPHSGNRKKAALWLGGSGALYVLALLSKSSVVALPLMGWAIAALWARRPLKETWPLLATAVGGAVVMTILKHGAESGGDAVIDPLRFRPIVAGDAIAFYALKTLLPWPLAPDYGRTPVWLAAHPRQWVWAAAALVALTVGAASCRTRPKLGLAMVFFLAPLLPVLGFVPFLYQSYSTVADRYAYLALLGPAFLVGEAVVWAACHGRERRLAPAAAFLALLLIVLSWHQIPLWHDDVAWARYTIAFVPQAPSGYINLGLADMDAGDLAGARTALRTGLLACPGDVKLDHDMATLLMQAHEPGQAVKYLRICATKLGTADAYYDLGHGLLDAGETKPGLAALREAYQLGPDSTKAETIAIHLAQQGNLGGAEEWFSRALLANPNDIPAAFSLGMIAAQRGQTALARQRFQAVVQFAPQSPEGGMAANYLAKNP